MTIQNHENSNNETLKNPTVDNENVENPKATCSCKKDKNAPKRSYKVKPEGMSDEETIQYYKERKKIANLKYQENHKNVIRACQDRYFQKEDVKERMRIYRINKKAEKAQISLDV
jgi:predicted metal-binding transcription factor (methanogenesis marker protein 9)